MLCSRIKLVDETGSAALEFIAFGLLASLGIMFATLELQSLQTKQFMTQQFSKQLARVLVSNPSQQSFDQVMNALTNAYQISREQVAVEISCVPSCETLGAISPGALIEVRIEIDDQSSVSRMRAAR